MPTVLHDIAWRAMQVHGALGVSNEMPFFGMVHGAAVMGLADGPTEVHKVTVARQVLRGYKAGDELWPTRVDPGEAGSGQGEVRRVPRARSGEPVIDIDRLGDWMDGMGLPGKGDPIEHRYISGGSQNEIYEIRRGELHGALRIPPPTAPAPRDDGIIREWRIIEALDGTDVPHTPAIGMCADTAVLGRAFYLMGFVDGWSPMGMDYWPAPFDTDLEARAGLAYQLVEGIALLSNVDWQAKGLQDLGRPDGFHERQVDRWTAFLERIKGRELPGFDVASAWLREHRPLDFIPGLMHGDYQFANVMYRDGAPAAAGRDRRLGDGHRRRPEARPRLGRPELARGHDLARRRGVELRRHDRHADEGPGPRALLEGVGPPGRRHRLLRHPRQVEARHRARTGLPARRATTRSSTPSARSCSTSCRARPSSPRATDYRS